MTMPRENSYASAGYAGRGPAPLDALMHPKTASRLVQYDYDIAIAAASEDEGTSFSWFWALMFGPLYFAVHGLWKHFWISVLVTVMTLGFLQWLYSAIVARGAWRERTVAKARSMQQQRVAMQR